MSTDKPEIIELTQDIPVGRPHDLQKGNQYEVIRWERDENRPYGVWVISKTGEEVKILRREFKKIEGDKEE